MIVILYLFKYLLHLILFIYKVQGTHSTDKGSPGGMSPAETKQPVEAEQGGSSMNDDTHRCRSFWVVGGSLCVFFWVNLCDGRGWR